MIGPLDMCMYACLCVSVCAYAHGTNTDFYSATVCKNVILRRMENNFEKKKNSHTKSQILTGLPYGSKGVSVAIFIIKTCSLN